MIRLVSVRYAALCLAGVGSSVAAPSPATVRAQGAAPFVYTPGAQQYRITTVTKRTQDQSGGRAPFEFEVTTTQYVTVRITSAGHDTLGVAIAMDSLAVASTLDALPADTDGFKGTVLRGTMSPQGRMYAFEAPAGTQPGKVTALYRAFRPFLVPFPSTAMAPGLTWTDSTVDHIEKKPFSITSTSVTTWTVTGDTTYAGQKAWRVERVAIVTTSGTGTEGTMPLHLEGDDTIRGVRYVTMGGVYVGGSATQTSLLQMNTQVGADQSESSPIRQTIKTTIQPLSMLRTAGS
jgi:hypothetical protein